MRFRIAGTIAASLTALIVSAGADEIADKGREILEKNKAAVVTVELVMKQKFSMPGMDSQENENKAEMTATVIDATGLAIMSLSESDPASMMEAMMSGGQFDDMKMDTEITDAKIILEDETEVPAEIILRDKDLDIAFIRPVRKPEKEFAYVDMTKTGAPLVLDQVISVNRLGKVARRVHAASVERITAVVDKPRTFYIPGNDPTHTGMGSPAFTLDGQAVGVFLVRVIKESGGGGMGMFGGGMEDNVMGIILPAADVLEAAQQAPPFGEKAPAE